MSITPNHDACATFTALTSSSATIITPPPATSMRNDTMRCFRKLRCFSTPQASLTALVMAPNTPSDAQMSAEAAGHAHRHAGLAEGIELGVDEIELRREVAGTRM